MATITSFPTLTSLNNTALNGVAQIVSGFEAAIPSVTSPSTQPAASSQSPSTDTRLRLTALNPDDVFKDGGILAVLKTTNGMLFPYTPTINFTQAVNYMDLQLVHSNTDYAAYTRTPSVSISVSGKFTVQNQQEGQYALACLHFLRSVSKMYFGELDKDKAGLPPPVLVLDGYGNYIFNKVRCVLKSHNWSFDDSADGIDINIAAPSSTNMLSSALGPNVTALGNVSGLGGLSGLLSSSNLTGSGGVARLPSLFTVSCELLVVQTPQRMREQFSFDKFASGQLMQAGSPGWI